MRPPTQLRLVVAAVLAFATLSCGGSDGTSPDDGDDIDRVVVSPSADEVEIDGSIQFTALVINKRGDDVTASSVVLWSTEPSSVATVDGNGRVTGVDDGTATLRATVSGVTGQATVTVIDPNPPSAPSDVVSVAVTDTEVDVAWEDNSDNEDEFRIEREVVAQAAVAGNGPAAVFEQVGTAGADQTTFRDTSLDPESSYRYRVRACNQNGCMPEAGSEEEEEATSEPVVTHATLILETTSLPAGVLDREYEAELLASGGNDSFAWALAGGALPDGLSLSGDGVIAGTPVETGTFDFTVEVTSGGQVESGELSIEVSEIVDPEITTTTLPNGVVGASYAAQLEAQLGDGTNYVFAVVAGGLPAGLSLGSGGAITGTPTAAGSSSFTVEVTSAELTGSAELTIDVFAPVAVVTSSLPDGVEGQAYEASLEASGGDGAFEWSLEGGMLPDGLALDADGTISGTPAAASSPAAAAPVTGGPAAVGTFDFSVRVSSGDGQAVTADLSISVWAPLVMTTTEFPDGEAGTAYAATATAEGGDGSYTWSASTLPPGLGLDSGTGQISGTPTTAGTTDFTLTVTSGDGQSVQGSFSITIAPGPPTITTTSLPGGTVGESYSQTLSASGGDGTFTWAVVSGSLPGGLALDGSSGVISGTPSATGTFDFTVEVTSAGMTDDQALSISVSSSGPLSLDTDFLAGGNRGVSYSQTLTVSGGAGGNTWSVTNGGLPPGLSLGASSGQLTGTPSSAGVFYFTIRVSSGGSNASKTFAVAISAKAPSAFNMWVMNVAGNSIPSNAVITAIEDAVARWEDVITGDLANYSIGASELPSGACGGDGSMVNGQTIDDMVVMLNLENIDGPGGTLGSAGPCWGFGGASPRTIVGRLTLDTSDLGALSAGQSFALAFHEIGHVVGIGTFWSTAGLISDEGGPDPRYEGAGGNAEFTGTLGGGSAGASKIPIEADGGSGTAYGHWDEGEFDNEIMTGFSEAAGTSQPISAMTIASLGDFGYSVNTGAADPYSIPGCAPGCSPPQPAGAPSGESIGVRILDDISRDPIGLIMPDGTVVFVRPGGLR